MLNGMGMTVTFPCMTQLLLHLTSDNVLRLIGAAN